MSFMAVGRAGARGLMVALLLAASATAAEAQGWIERPVPGDFGVRKLRTTVRVTVRDRVAQVDVEEWFRNDGAPFAQADYLYPLPAGASFSSYSLWQGDQELRGEMMDAGEARGIYEEIVRRKRDPALIELAGHGLIRARVFPIATGETRRIRLRYTQLLPRAADALEFRYTAGRRNNAQPQSTDVPLTFTMTIEDGARYREPFSPTHDIRSQRTGARLSVSTRERLSGDFALFLPFAEKPVGITLATHRPDSDEDGWFMLTLSPAEVARARRVPRDVTVVVDVSGSMSGGKLEQARGAVRQLLGTLGEQDRLRLIRFSTNVTSWRTGWTDASPEALSDARRWVSQLEAEGSTNIAGALKQAFALPSQADRLAVVLFLTDGLATVGERDPERIAQQAERTRGEARVFAFGVGYDVNTYLLDRLSAAARGSTQYVRPEEDIETAVSALATRIRYPVLTDLQVDVEGASVSELYPSELPDLFAGEELVLLGRYTPRAGEGRIVVRGRRERTPERYVSNATFARHSPAHDYLPRLWATRKIGELTRELKLHGHDREIEEEIRRTALRYGVLSEYTSYLVQEPNSPLLADLQAPPSAASFVGEAAVGAAVQSKARREASTMSQLRALDAAVAPAGGPAGEATRNVAGRTFRLRGGVWEDVQHRAAAEVVEVRAFSAAYFDVLRALPELRPYLAELADVLVAGSKTSLRVRASSGKEQLSVAALAALVRDFRDAKVTTR